MNTKGVSTRRIAVLVFAGMLTACGGGGGDGGGSGVGGGGGATPLVYSGNSSPAVITTSNAAQLTANILGSANASGAVSGVSTGTESSGARELGRRLIGAIRATPSLSRENRKRLTSDPVDRTQACDSGSVRIFGDVNQSGTGTLTFVWSNCRTGDSTLDGTASVRVDAFDPVSELIIDETFNFQRVTLTSPTASGTISGSLRVELSIVGKRQTSTSNLITLDGNGRMTKSEDFVVTDTYNDIVAPTSVSETITGRFFDSTHGVVNIVTNAPFVFATLTQLFPNSGEMVLTGASNRRVRAVAFSSRAVTLGLDLIGDAAFERTASLAWADLGGPAGSDLADDDSDGMHNSWETAKGFDPSDPSDAVLDADGDGATNAAEYQAGTNPRDADSRP